MAGHRPAAHQSALFVGEVHNLQCMAQADVPVAQLLRYLDAADDANITIVVAAMRHRVRVRAEDDRR